ncbi:MAG: prephenate dehydrogenase [Planctomycetaceae bacterium]
MMRGMVEPQAKSEKRVVVVGVGLIGGSVAAAVRHRLPDCQVVGIGRCEQRLQAAADAGLLTGWATDVTSEMLSGRCVVVVCLPVHLIATHVRRIAEKASDDVLITDAGSVKAVICDAVNEHEAASRLFVGAHPIAGGEQGGFEHADADLFHDKVCVVVAGDATSARKPLVHRTRHFWQHLGCRIVDMTADEHDRVLALTSHLPHLMAAVTTTVAGTDNLSLTGSGFRDATRIAAGDAELWTAIMAGNRASVIAAIGRAEETLADYRKALEQQNDERLLELLATAAECRRKLSS